MLVIDKKGFFVRDNIGKRERFGNKLGMVNENLNCFYIYLKKKTIELHKFKWTK